MKKIVCVVLACAMLICFSGCKKNSLENNVNKNSQTTAETAQKGMQLLYCLSDTFNPYTAVTAINREICGLIYDSLIELDNEFNVIYAMASSVTVNGKICTASLKDVTFSDGSLVTSDDVVYSFNLAKASPTAYAGNLYEFIGARVLDKKTIEFTLSKADPYCVNLLDFPILKAGSEKITDADGVVHPPVGSGRYILNETKDKLIRNDGYYGVAGSIESIKLINAPDRESVSHYVEIGATDVYFTDVSDGQIVRMSGKKTDINLTNFIYIGINESNDILRNPYMRYAISSAINREAVCQTAYYNNAVEATGFFHPDFKPSKSLQNIGKNSDLKIVVENLEKIGYNKLDNDGYRKNSKGRHPKFTLLVNSDNASKMKAAELICAQFKDAGMELQIIGKTYTEYMAALSSGSFQLYLGEIKLTANMDFSSLVVAGGSAAFGRTATVEEHEEVDPQNAETSKPVKASDIIEGFYEGKYSFADTVSVLLTELPVIPICYRKGLLFYDSEVTNPASASQGDIYFSKETGYISVE